MVYFMLESNLIEFDHTWQFTPFKLFNSNLNLNIKLGLGTKDSDVCISGYTEL
jgi:hypothetical protein